MSQYSNSVIVSKQLMIMETVYTKWKWEREKWMAIKCLNLSTEKLFPFYSVSICTIFFDHEIWTVKTVFAVFVCLNKYVFFRTQQMFFKYSLGCTTLNFLKGRVPVSLITLRAVSYSQNPDYPGKGCALRNPALGHSKSSYSTENHVSCELSFKLVFITNLVVRKMIGHKWSCYC